MQALVEKKAVEHKSVVLWRTKKTKKLSAFDQIRLEMFFGSMVFTVGFYTRSHRTQATRN
jgi:hypothetical protein